MVEISIKAEYVRHISRALELAECGHFICYLGRNLKNGQGMEKEF